MQSHACGLSTGQKHGTEESVTHLLAGALSKMWV